MEPSKQLSKKLFIVVIDDSETVCRILESLLTQQGHQVTWFLDPVTAWYSIMKTGETPLPDLFFIDLALPRLNGYEMIKYLRNHPASLHIPIIVISRSDDTVIRLKARVAGANAYLAKPFKPQDVIALILPFTRSPNSSTPENK